MRAGQNIRRNNYNILIQVYTKEEAASVAASSFDIKTQA